MPAPNSYSYKYNEYLLKLYLETIEKIEKANEIKYDKELYQKLITFMDDFCKKHNIILDSIRKDTYICIRNHMFLHFLKYEKLDTINDLSNEFKQKIENYKDKIKIFHFQFFYYLTIDLLKNTIDFFTEKKEITYCKCTHGDSTYSKQNLQSFCVEGLFIQGIKDCNLSFSIEPYVCSKMEISIKNEIHLKNE